jgi:hypothetical protein
MLNMNISSRIATKHYKSHSREQVLIYQSDINYKSHVPQLWISCS